MKRRAFLILALVGLLIGNLVFFSLDSEPQEEGFLAHWVAHMPELEQRQRADTANLIESSHHRDPRYPILYGHDETGNYPILVEMALKCDVKEFALKKYIVRSDDVNPSQMPDRFFVGAMSALEAACLETALPNGYVLAKLAEPDFPSKIGWKEDDLKISKIGSD